MALAGALLAACGAILAAAGALVLHGCTPAGRPGAATSGVTPNNACRICHAPMGTEPLATVHARKKVWCTNCHGPSRRHVEDDNIGGTPPDRVYARDRVDRLCGTCHNAARHPKLSDAERADRLAAGAKAWTEVTGRPAAFTGICTDCHGAHWIPRQAPAVKPSGA